MDMEKGIKAFIDGVKYVEVCAPVTKAHLTKPVDDHNEYKQLKTVKFVPASGAATRMFASLYHYLKTNDLSGDVKAFFNHLEAFPFYEDLYGFIKDFNKESAIDKGKIIKRLLEVEYLGYGSLPKAFIKMNAYENYALTPLDEHLYEGLKILNPESLSYHFTISKAHEKLFLDYSHKVKEKYPNVQVNYSFQKAKTDTLAVDLNNKPVIKEDGTYLTRPGGHGALIENLNDIDADIIFIKNIDNVCHKRLLSDTIASKQSLAATGYKVKARIDTFIKALLNETEDFEAIKAFMHDVLHIKFKREITKQDALKLLNRPLRVCGVVKNTGAPGGGPFVVENADYFDLQIVETSEMDLIDTHVQKMLDQSEYFNPVDLVCFVKDYKGDKFNLLDYVNHARYFISEKTDQGKRIKALEHPGLWNGAMHHWNTILIEVPLTTFNPVKTVNDLLKPAHQEKKRCL